MFVVILLLRAIFFTKIKQREVNVRIATLVVWISHV